MTNLKKSTAIAFLYTLVIGAIALLGVEEIIVFAFGVSIPFSVPIFYITSYLLNDDGQIISSTSMQTNFVSSALIGSFLASFSFTFLALLVKKRLKDRKKR